MLDICRVPFDHPDAEKLIADLQAFYGERYGDDGDETVVAVGDFAPPRGGFLVGYLDGEPVACGGWRSRDADPDDPAVRDGDAEVKRMFVAPDGRGRGFGRSLLSAIEDSARTAGRSRAILETGVPQHEAIALYTSSGYAPIPKFGRYRRSPLSRCYGKDLTAPPPASSRR